VSRPGEEGDTEVRGEPEEKQGTEDETGKSESRRLGSLGQSRPGRPGGEPRGGRPEPGWVDWTKEAGGSPGKQKRIWEWKTQAKVGLGCLDGIRVEREGSQGQEEDRGERGKPASGEAPNPGREVPSELSTVPPRQGKDGPEPIGNRGRGTREGGSGVYQGGQETRGGSGLGEIQEFGERDRENPRGLGGKKEDREKGGSEGKTLVSETEIQAGGGRRVGAESGSQAKKGEKGGRVWRPKEERGESQTGSPGAKEAGSGQSQGPEKASTCASPGPGAWTPGRDPRVT
jgi:hypothetical protein